MLQLLYTEWLKLRKYPAFWAMLAIVALSYPGMNWILYTNYKDELNDPKMGLLLRMLPNPFTFPDVWQNVAYVSSMLIFLPALLVIMFITNEYTYKTHRQNIIDGWSRRQFMLGKLADVLIISVLITLLCAGTAFAIGALNRGNGTVVPPSQGVQYIGLFFLQVFSQLSLALLVALLVRKAFIALGIFMFYYFPLEPIIVGLSKKKWHLGFGEFMPLEISDRLLPYPRWFSRDEADWKASMAQSNTHIAYTLLLIAATWALCFCINKKRDL